MSFLSESLIADKKRSIRSHPLLAKTSLSANVRSCYLEGLVLAALLKNGAASQEAEQKVREIAFSLGLVTEDVDETITQLSGLNDREKGQLIDDLKTTLNEAPVSIYFMRDFESIVKSDGTISEDVRAGLDLVGSLVMGREDWRGAIRDSETAEANRAIAKVIRRGEALLYGQEDVEEDPEKALALFQSVKDRDATGRAAKLEVEATVALGMKLMFGDDSTRANPARAVRLFESVKDRDESGEALTQLAYCYYHGLGVRKDMTQTYIHAYNAHGKTAESRYILGCLERYGGGRQRDPDYDRARKYFEEAAAMGYENAAEALRELGDAPTPRRHRRSDDIDGLMWDYGY